MHLFISHFKVVRVPYGRVIICYVTYRSYNRLLDGSCCCLYPGFCSLTPRNLSHWRWLTYCSICVLLVWLDFTHSVTVRRNCDLSLIQDLLLGIEVWPLNWLNLCSYLNSTDAKSVQLLQVGVGHWTLAVSAFPDCIMWISFWGQCCNMALKMLLRKYYCIRTDRKPNCSFSAWHEKCTVSKKLTFFFATY